MTEQLNIPATLRRAADVIEQVGWCRNNLQKSTGEVCALGAIAVAQDYLSIKYNLKRLGEDPYTKLNNDEVVQYFAGYVSDKVDRDDTDSGSDDVYIRAVYRWNDQYDEVGALNDKENVVATLRQAADHYEMGALK